ncbi:hypothetical protein NDU88_003342 [Pleurodeles waltl]|uniref:Uncharacterized protein n=1 Tax=Pleurodeles waltl TaxID=8319 RepID=A0AAV7TPF6_PLEWA|nr:hypothetical protein NDU88_003342 [Pleurodeles waltl]
MSPSKIVGRTPVPFSPLRLPGSSQGPGLRRLSSIARRFSEEGRQPLGSAVPRAGPRSGRHTKWSRGSPGSQRSEEGGGTGGHAASWPSPTGVPSPLLLAQSLSEVGSRLPARFSPLRLPQCTRGPGLRQL